jgi:hypothetical protein
MCLVPSYQVSKYCIVIYFIFINLLLVERQSSVQLEQMNALRKAIDAIQQQQQIEVKLASPALAKWHLEVSSYICLVLILFILFNLI